MELPTIQNGQRKVVQIKEGEVFCLPSRIPHSPQRPETGSLGLVIERERYVDPLILNGHEPELDGLRWFVNFEETTGKDILWEKFFHCYDLGRDLVPVVQEYHSSTEKTSRVPSSNSVLTKETRPLIVDETTTVPDPFNLMEWIGSHLDQIKDCEKGLDLFHHGDSEKSAHPDREYKIRISGGFDLADGEDKIVKYESWKGDTWLYQINGSSCVLLGGESDRTNGQQLLERCSGVVPPNCPFEVVHERRGGLLMMVQNDWCGNK
jgi:3-hydroxyanthranilate 3,4-dioxygenase